MPFKPRPKNQFRYYVRLCKRCNRYFKSPFKHGVVCQKCEMKNQYG